MICFVRNKYILVLTFIIFVFLELLTVKTEINAVCSSSCPSGMAAFCLAATGDSSCTVIEDSWTGCASQCTGTGDGGGGGYVGRSCSPAQLTCGSSSEAGAWNSAWRRAECDGYFSSRLAFNPNNGQGACQVNCMCCPSGYSRQCSVGATYQKANIGSESMICSSKSDLYISDAANPAYNPNLAPEDQAPGVCEEVLHSNGNLVWQCKTRLTTCGQNACSCVATNSPPTGTLSCPSTVTVGIGKTFTLRANDVDSNLQTAKLWRTASPPSNAFTETWSGGCSGGSCTSTVSWTPSEVGTYTFATTYHDTAGAACSGNPYYAYSDYPVYGFSACSNPLSSSSCTVDAVCAPVNGVSGSCGGGNGVTTCDNPATCTTGTLSSIDPTGADGVFNWGCSGTAGECGGTSGSSVTCSAPHLPDVSGVCGSSNGGDFISAPSNNLCTGAVTWTDNVGADGVFNWICPGSCAGVSPSCSATRNFAPVFNSLTIKNNSGTVVVAESGNKNQICQTEFGDSRNITVEVSASDPDGVADISNITVVWNGITIPRLTAIGAVTTFGGTPDSSYNYNLAYPLVVTITDSQGQVATDSSRSFKIWDCIVPISGAIYDDSAQLGCGGGFSLLADASMAFSSLTYKNQSGGADVVASVSPPSTFGSNNLVWGKSYLPLINGGNVLNPEGNLMATGRTTRLIDVGVGTTICPVSAQFNVGTNVSAYSTSPSLKVDLSYIRDQENWFQGNGIDIRAGDKITEGVPVTAPNPYLVLNRGLVAAPILENTNGYNNVWHYGQPPYNWFLEEALIDPHKQSYQSIYDEYFLKMGEGTTGVTVIDTGSTGVLFVNVGITISNNVVVAPNKYLMVVVNGDVTIDPTVNNVDGIYVAKNISAGGKSNTQLKINGVLYATNGGEIRLNRSFTTKRDNNPTPAVAVSYRPDMIFALPGRLSKVLSGWREL